ncbi:MAG: CDP-alcohol phosphatidyltransferase family protein [Cellulosilyticaceae bacterium]
MKFKQLFNIPNILSLVRILLVPVFIYIYLNAQTKESFYLAAFILFVSGLTDALDGYIARKYNLITELGKVIDPFADKLTQATVAICLALRIQGMLVLLSIFVIKEVTMIIGSGILLKKRVEIDGAKWFGKLATVVFYVVMFLVVAIPDMQSSMRIILIGLSAVFMIFSFVMYIPEFKRHLNKTTKS